MINIVLFNIASSGQGILTINNSTYTITSGKIFKNLKGITPNTFRKQSIHYDTLQTIYDFSATKKIHLCNHISVFLYSI